MAITDIHPENVSSIVDAAAAVRFRRGEYQPAGADGALGAPIPGYVAGDWIVTRSDGCRYEKRGHWVIAHVPTGAIGFRRIPGRSGWFIDRLADAKALCRLVVAAMDHYDVAIHTYADSTTAAATSAAMAIRELARNIGR